MRKAVSMTCSAANCDRTVYAREHCSRHYRQLLRHGEVQPEPLAPGRCAAEGCERAAATRGWCHGHYLRWSRTGDLGADRPLRRPDSAACSVPCCPRPVHATSLCRAHLNRLRQRGDVLADQPLREVTGAGSLSHGYWRVPVPEHLRRLVDGATYAAEHRLVMAQLLGRPLLPDETVHHRNGDRLDNRTGNLELWSCMQPAGQRVQDKLAFALEIVSRYAPDAGLPGPLT